LGVFILDRLGIALLLIAGLPLAGCDVIYGVHRHATLEALPDLACVERVVRAASGVQDVGHWAGQGGRALTLSGFLQPELTFTFVYSGKQPKIEGALELIRDQKGKVQFYQSLVRYQPPDPVVIANTRPVMREIEFTLSRDCGIPELPAGIKETCDGVDCPPMS